jgi:glyoxylase-like metal-dependent hydrolase (beta-lactamase superfamily II)
MKVNDELYILELPLAFGGTVRIMNVSLIADPEHGLTLVDTGLPGQVDLIQEALAQHDFTLDHIKHIVLTHQDLDHVGSLNEIKELTQAPIYAYIDEVPYIDGTLPMTKAPSPEVLAQNPGFAAIWEAFKVTPVDHAVSDGETLDFAVGTMIVATPGHTPGHMSLYLPNSKTLITGDALTSEEGTLSGPAEFATPELAQAKESVKKLADLDIETILCYHGGLVTEDANGQLKKVAGI